MPNDYLTIIFLPVIQIYIWDNCKNIENFVEIHRIFWCSEVYGSFYQNWTSATVENGINKIITVSVVQQMSRYLWSTVYTL